jgi:hypothetical protein
MGALDHLTEKKEEQVGEVLKMWVLVPRVAPRVLVPRVLAPGLRSRVSKSHRRINRGLEELRGGC